MLIASCHARGQEVRLVVGHSRWLQNLLLDDHAEFFDLVTTLDQAICDDLDISRIRSEMDRLGPSDFAAKLVRLHKIFILDKDPRSYLDSTQLTELVELSKAAGTVYDYYCLHAVDRRLSIVQRYIDEIRLINPDYIGFSLNRFPKPVMRAVIAAARREFGLPVIFGGWITPFMTDKHKATLLSGNPRGCLVAGLADETLPELLGALDRGGDPITVPGVFQTRGDTLVGAPVKTQPDVDSLPFPDFSQYDLDAFAVPALVLPIQTARGWRTPPPCGAWTSRITGAGWLAMV